MLIVGLTGSIGMGKSATAAMVAEFGVPVIDSDRLVHGLMGPGGKAVPAILSAFPGAEGPMGIDRTKLGAAVFGQPARLRQLESILHPLVAASQREKIATFARRRVPMVLLDIPLLFETGAERRLDYTVVVTAPAAMQARRVLKRPGMTEARLDHILSQQMPDALKRKRADFIITTALGKAHSRRRVARLMRVLRHRKGQQWGPGWGQGLPS